MASDPPADTVSPLLGILSAVSEGEEYREQVIKGKSLTGTSAVSVLHSQLDGGGELVCGYVSRVLRLVAEDPAVRGGRERAQQ